MNIYPIRPLGFKAISNRARSLAQSKANAAFHTNAYASEEITKANFFSQVSFEGKKTKTNIKLSNAILSVLNSSVKGVTGEKINEELANKFRTGKATEEELFQTLNLKKDDQLVAQDLAEFSFEEYINITNNLGYKNKLTLLKTAQDKGYKFTIAHSLAINPDKYEKATRDLSKKDRLDLLKMKDSYGRSVAHLLANEAYYSEYIVPLSAIIGGFSKHDISNLLSMEDSNGNTVEYTLENHPGSKCLTVLKNIFEIN